MHPQKQTRSPADRISNFNLFRLKRKAKRGLGRVLTVDDGVSDSGETHPGEK